MGWIVVELLLYRDEARHFVQLRSWREGDATVTPPRRAATSLDLDALHAELGAGLMDAYGRRLAAMLFAPGEIAAEWSSLRDEADRAGATLRVQLVIDDSAPELHNLRWETLRDARDPLHERWLLTSERVLFTRLMPSRRYFKLRPRDELRALLFVANPRSRGVLDPIAVDAEVARARAALHGVPITEIASDAAHPGRATADRLIDEIRGADLVVLIAHGALLVDPRGGAPRPHLYLERPDGGVHQVAADRLVDRIGDLPRQPTLMVLVSCQSAGTGDDTAGDDGALAAFGPSLARAGVGAVVAMQGKVRMSTMAAFVPTLLAELLASGEIDRALAAARGKVRDAADGWMPALFLRLRGGRIWYSPGLDGGEFGAWDTLRAAILTGSCLPIAGMGLHQRRIGATGSIVAAFARRVGAMPPLGGPQELPRLTQYLAPTKKRKAVLDNVACALLQSLAARDPLAQPVELDKEPRPWSQWNRLLVDAWRRDAAPDEPHRVLASLPLAIYVTTNVDDVLAEALREAGRKPEVAALRWNDRMGLDRKRELVKTVFELDPSYLPSPERPLVFHLYGRADDPDSIVLTEDDHFDYLLWFQREVAHVPECVAAAWTTLPLLLLGFELGDWSFRVMLRSILDEQRSAARRDYSSVAAQLEPQDVVGEPARARAWLETYFDKRADVRLFWGTADDFAAALARRLGRAAPAAAGGRP